MPNWKKVLVSGSNAHLNQVTASSGIQLADDAFLNLGDENDLQLYHDGSNSYIKDAGTGALFYRGGTQTFQNAAGSKTMATLNAANSVDLNYNNNTKFQTTNTGVSITGNVVSSGNVSGSASSTGSFGELHIDDKIGLGTADPDTELYVKGGVTTGTITATTGTNKGIIHIDGGTANTSKYMITFGNQSTATTSNPIGVMGVHNDHSQGSGLFFGISTSYSNGINRIPLIIAPQATDGQVKIESTGVNIVGNLTSTGNISGSNSSTGSFGSVFTDGGVNIGGGFVDIKNNGSQSAIRFYCEVNNAHFQTVKAAPHSETASNTLVLPSVGTVFATTDGAQTLTNKTLTSPDINSPDIDGGTVDAITSLTAANDLDIGAYELRAQTFESDVTTGTAPFTVASTTVVSNLNSDKLDGQEGSYYLDFSNFVVDNDEIPIAKLAEDSITIAGNSTALGGSITTATILDESGVVSGSAQINSLINDTIAATIVAEIDNDEIPIAKLAQDSITIAGNSTALGGSITTATILDESTVISGSGSPNITTVGALNAGSITSGFTSIDVGSGAIQTTGTGSFGRVEATTITASRLDVDAGTLAVGGTSINKTIADNIQNTSGTNTGDVTLSGTPDYITISNQVITRNQIDLANDVTGTLPVGNGGTGATTLTDGGVLLGSGTGAITATAVLTNGQLLIGDGSGDPTVGTLTGTSNQITVTNGAGSITLSTPQNIHTSANPTFAGGTLGNVKVGVTADGEIDTSSGNLTIDSAGGTITLDDDVIVSGNFTVSGTQTIVDSTTVNIADNIIELNAGTSDGGLFVKETQGGNATGSLLYDVSENRWVAGTAGAEVNLVTISSTDTLTNKSINASNNTLTNIPNSALTNDGITIAGVDTSLGGTITQATILDESSVVSSSAQINSLINDTIAATIVAEIDNDEIPIAKLASDAITIAGNSTSLGGSITQATILNGSTVISGSRGISNDNIVEIDDSDVADNDYAKFTANGLEGRSFSEVRSDLNVEDGADVTDATNVTAAGALMDSELTNLAAVKAINQGLTTSSDVQFNDLRADSVGVGMAASSTSGRLDCTNDVAAFSSSDRRWKKNIINISNPLDKISKIGGYEFDWKELTEEERETQHGNSGHDVGVIAQEVQEVLPEVVKERDNGYLAVDYEKLVPLLIESIKELKNEVEELKKKV